MNLWIWGMERSCVGFEIFGSVVRKDSWVGHFFREGYMVKDWDLTIFLRYDGIAD